MSTAGDTGPDVCEEEIEVRCYDAGPFDEGRVDTFYYQGDENHDPRKVLYRKTDDEEVDRVVFILESSPVVC